MRTNIEWRSFVLSDESLDWRHEPGVQSVTVGGDGHRVLDLLLEKRLPDEQDGDAEDEEEDAEDRRGHAAVPRVLAVAAPLRRLGAVRGLCNRRFGMTNLDL